MSGEIFTEVVAPDLPEGYVFKVEQSYHGFLVSLCKKVGWFRSAHDLVPHLECQYNSFCFGDAESIRSTMEKLLNRLTAYKKSAAEEAEIQRKRKAMEGYYPPRRVIGVVRNMHGEQETTSP